tara:strand:+ start:555 stop:1556 length:1002 start_codon:yes stop_codon:yes gene_type:complete
MGKGGGGGGAPPPQPTSSTVNQSNLPEYAEPFFTRLLEDTEALAGEAYQPIDLQRIAGFDPRQEQSFNLAAGIAEGGIPEEFSAARTELGEAMAFDPGYTPGEIQARQFTDPGVAESYMNPFIENVIDVQQARARRQFQEDTAPKLAAQAVGAGAFGGSRQGIVSQMAAERLEDRLADMEATQRAQAFSDAQRAFESDRTADLRAAALREEAAQQAGRIGLAGTQLGMEAARDTAALGEAELGLGLRQADVLRQIGEQRQAMDQQELDIALSDFISQRDFPRQNLVFRSGILRGIPVSPMSETAQFQAQPSAFQQMLGFGLGGLGLARNVFGR